MTLLPPPRAWVGWTVPKDADGNDLGVATDASAFEHYVHWLADYLFKAQIPVPDSQMEMLRIYRESGGAEHATSNLSERIGYTTTEVEGIERDFAEGISWENFHTHERSCWNDFSTEEQELQTEEEFLSGEKNARESVGKDWKPVSCRPTSGMPTFRGAPCWQRYSERFPIMIVAATGCAGSI